MLGDDLRQIRSLASQYRLALLIAAAVVAFASLFIGHINSNDEAARALGRVYDGTPHFEWRLKDATHPSR